MLECKTRLTSLKPDNWYAYLSRGGGDRKMPILTSKNGVMRSSQDGIENS